MKLGKNISCPIIIALLIVATNVHGGKTTTNKYKSDARKTTDWTSAGKKQQLDFNYGNAKATLRQTGDIIIEATVFHKGLLCATYSAGMRFGKGNPGCVEVKWLTEPKYMTSRKQCNSAVIIHSGADMDVDAAKLYDKISCGQLLLKCVGNCK